MADQWTDAAAGAVAGVIGGVALQAVAQFMYDRTGAADVGRERRIEPRDPFIVLARKVQDATGVEMTGPQEKAFEQAVATAFSAAAGATYAVTARHWPLGWLAGGVVFGALFWAVEDEGIGPAMGLVGANTEYPAEAHLRGLAAHVAYGVVTAGLLAACGLPSRPDRR